MPKDPSTNSRSGNGWRRRSEMICMEGSLREEFAKEGIAVANCWCKGRIRRVYSAEILASWDRLGNWQLCIGQSYSDCIVF
jgi:hypothetical protein